MRLNGGVIGANNRPTNRTAGGVWKWSEQQTHILYETFPMYYEGYDLIRLFNTQTYYTGQNVNVSSVETTRTSIAFKTDGTKMYVLGSISDNVSQYSLSSAWNLATATPDNIYFSVRGIPGDGTPESLRFKPDGTKMYVLGSSNDNVVQYSLSTAWNVGTASYDNKTLSVATQDGTMQGLEFKPDGTKMYTCGAGNLVYQYSLATAWDVSTGTYDNISFDITNQDGDPTGIALSNNGTIMYISGTSTDNVYSYFLSTPWNIATATHTANLNVANTLFPLPTANYNNTALFSVEDIFIKGNNLFICDDGNDMILRFNVGTDSSFNLITGYTTSANLISSMASNSLSEIFFTEDGKRLYTLSGTSDLVYQYSLSSGWDLNTISYDNKTYSVTSQESSPTGLSFKTDGSKMYVIGTNTDSIYQYSLSNPWDVSTASYDNKSQNVASQTTSIGGVFIKPDGTKLYVYSSSIYQYSFGTAWDLSTLSYDNKSFNLRLGGNSFLNNSSAGGCWFNPNGSKMFISDSVQDRILQYSLSVSWDVSTAIYSGLYYTIPTNIIPNTTAGGGPFIMKPNGSKMYFGYSRHIYEISLNP